MTAPARIFHISGNHYLPFPAAHHTRRIWDELAKDFDEYHVFARGRTWRYCHCVEGKIHLHLLPEFGKRMWPFFFISWLLPLFVLRYRPSRLLAQCPVMGGLSAAFCTRIFNIPLFIELHGTHYFRSGRPGWRGTCEHLFYRALSRFSFRSASVIRSLSQDMTEQLLSLYGEELARKVVVIPNRVDLDVFCLPKPSYVLDGPLKIVTVGNFSPNKNHIRLMEDLCASGVDFKLTIVGGGALGDDYLRCAQRLDITDRLTITRLEHRALAELLPQQDVYVHYSLAEGVSRAILEAMAVGLPVVATRVGFIKGVLHDGQDAIVIDRPYSEGLVTAIRTLACSEKLRRSLGTAARRAVEDHFEWNRVFMQYRCSIAGMQ